MPSPDPEADVATLVATATGRVVGTSLFQGPQLAVAEGAPADCIFVQARKGDRPQPLMGAGRTVWSADVEVLVRGPPRDREQARTTARGALQALQQATRGGGFPGYSLALVVEGEPEYVAKDVSQCHLYAFALTVQWVG